MAELRREIKHAAERLLEISLGPVLNLGIPARWIV